MLETIIGVSILVAVALFTKKIFSRTGSTTTPPIVGGGDVPPSPSEVPGRTYDGSVTPPTQGENVK